MSARRFTAAEIARRLGGTLVGDGDLVIVGVEDLREAGPDQLSFVANPRYLRHLPGCRAGAVLVRPSQPTPGLTRIELADPYLGFARAMQLFHPLRWPEGGVSPRAEVHPGAVLGDGACVEAFAVVGEGARLGEGAWVQSGAYVGAGARLGARCRLMPGAVVMEGCVLGDEVVLNPGAVVGSEGFGFAPTREGHVKIPQPGGVVLGDGVELGANTCVDRPALGVTRVGEGSKLDNLCQIGHAAQVGPRALMVAFSGVAGSATLGEGVTLAVRSTVLGHIELGAGSVVAAHSLVAHGQAPGAEVAGVPAVPRGEWLRVVAAARRLPALVDEVAALRRELAALKGRGEEKP